MGVVQTIQETLPWDENSESKVQILCALLFPELHIIIKSNEMMYTCQKKKL